MIEVIDPRYRYYVYTLAHPDGCVFYVGKGTGGRILSHEDEAQRGCACPKCKIIRGIWENGKRVKRAIVFRTNSEQEAYGYEKGTIEALGYTQLCNKDPRTPTTPREILAYRSEVAREQKEDRELEKQLRRDRYEQAQEDIRRRKEREAAWQNTWLPKGQKGRQ